MRKLLSTMLLSAALMASPGYAAETNTQRITETMDLLQKEVSCIMITDYSIRHLNLFIHQMETLNNSNGERKKAVAPLVLMAVMMRMDADKLTNELVALGLDKTYINKKITEVSDAIVERYSQGYIDSSNYDKAATFIQTLMSEQGDCEIWFKARFGNQLPPLPAPDGTNKGGVDG